MTRELHDRHSIGDDVATQDNQWDLAMAQYGSRHPGTRHMLYTLTPNHRLDGIAFDVAQSIWDQAQEMANLLKDGPELTQGLRYLRQAKDCFVIQGLIDSNKIGHD
jgi:hypothetical protein